MTRTKKTATLLTTLSVRLDDATFARLVAAANRENRLLSDFVRLLIQRAHDASCDGAGSAGSLKATAAASEGPARRSW